MKKIMMILMASLTSLSCAQDVPKPLPAVTPASTTQQLSTQPPPPVSVNGKLQREMNDDEMREFLQNKVKQIHQDDGGVEIVRIAPGYPLTLRFSEPIIRISCGDQGLIGIEKAPKFLELSARDRVGDTPLKVFFPGNKIRIYHVFVEESFVNTDTVKTVAPFGGGAVNVAYQTSGSSEDIQSFLKIIQNYDALLSEGGIDKRAVSRTEIFRTNPATGFAFYYLYKINGGIAISFAYRNNYPYRVRLDESRLRINIGNMNFIPDFVTVTSATGGKVLDPNQAASGVAIVFHPTFNTSQQFEIIWK